MFCLVMLPAGMQGFLMGCGVCPKSGADGDRPTGVNGDRPTGRRWYIIGSNFAKHTLCKNGKRNW